jgi:hypothetical protein
MNRFTLFVTLASIRPITLTTWSRSIVANFAFRIIGGEVSPDLPATGVSMSPCNPMFEELVIMATLIKLVSLLNVSDDITKAARRFSVRLSE